jgi:hypothetical protein
VRLSCGLEQDVLFSRDIRSSEGEDRKGSVEHIDHWGDCWGSGQRSLKERVLARQVLKPLNPNTPTPKYSAGAKRPRTRGVHAAPH